MTEADGSPLPLDGEVTLAVRVVGGLPEPEAARALLRYLPSVTNVCDDAGLSRRFYVTTLSLARFLTELARVTARHEITIEWSPGHDVLLRVPEPRPPPPPRPLPPPPNSLSAPDDQGPPVSRTSPWVVAAVFSALIGALAIWTVVLARPWQPRLERAPPIQSNVPAAVEPLAHVTVLRSLASRCAMPAGRPCDAAAEARWRGDEAAWSAYAARTGQPLSEPGGAFQATVAFRLEAGDPSARIDLARGLGLPAVFITALTVTRIDGAAETEVEIANVGVATATLGGAEVLSQGQPLFRLSPEATLAAGARCRLSTSAHNENACAGTPAFVRRPAGDDLLPITLRARAGEEMDALRVSNSLP